MKTKCAIIDFDGTLVRVRAGWEIQMKIFFLEICRLTQTGNDCPSIRTLIKDFD